MKRIEFTLSMPSCGSWNGKWSGEGRHWAVVKKLTDKAAEKVMGSATAGTRYWSYRWDDGWCAGITARIMPPGQKAKKSAGFCGYDWMVENILAHGSPYHKDD